MLFSIITVCLNPGADLLPTVRSVLTQDSDDFELIIKDGGSTDGTECGTFVDTRLRFVSSPDAGIYDAMNQALALATGEFVCFLNAGDFFVDSTVLSDIARFAGARGDTHLIYGDIFNAAGRAGYTIYPNRLSRLYLFKHMICHQSWFVRRSVYLSYGGFETQFVGASDYRLLLKMVVRDRLKYRHVPRVTAYYKGGGCSANPTVFRQSLFAGEELRRQLFHPIEYMGFTLFWGLWTALKFCFYDHCAGAFWRRYQQFRYSRDRRLSQVATDHDR